MSYRLMRFGGGQSTAGKLWEGVTVDDSDDLETILHAAENEYGRCITAGLPCAIVIVSPDRREVLFRTYGFVPLDIEERIYRAVDGGKTGEAARPTEDLALDRLLEIIADVLESQAVVDHRNADSLAQAVSLVRQYRLACSDCPCVPEIDAALAKHRTHGAHQEAEQND